MSVSPLPPPKNSYCSVRGEPKFRMTHWADNIKFVKDVIDSKYKKIDDAMTDVSQSNVQMFLMLKLSLSRIHVIISC